MPELGERKRGDAIGKTPKAYYVWAKCPECETGRWVNPKPSYQAPKNRVRFCTQHARDMNRFNVDVGSDPNPPVRGFGWWSN